MFSPDSARQTEEVDALRAIFGDAILPEDDPAKISVEIRARGSGYEEIWVKLSAILPEDYPSFSPPTFELSSPHMNAAQKEKLSRKLEEVYLENLGDPILYSWIQSVQSFLSEESSNGYSGKSPGSVHFDGEGAEMALPGFISGESLTDRKSHFQAHLASIDSPALVPLMLSKLKENGKIARATHNVYAYRICDCSNKLSPLWYADCDDDGETHAGSRLSHLLELVDARNVLVVVSRWYGGIHLGPDRFKHICNAARQLLISQGFVQSQSTNTPSKNKQKKKK